MKDIRQVTKEHIKNQLALLIAGHAENRIYIPCEFEPSHQSKVEFCTDDKRTLELLMIEWPAENKFDKITFGTYINYKYDDGRSSTQPICKEYDITKLNTAQIVDDVMAYIDRSIKFADDLKLERSKKLTQA